MCHCIGTYIYTTMIEFPCRSPVPPSSAQEIWHRNYKIYWRRQLRNKIIIIIRPGQKWHNNTSAHNILKDLLMCTPGIHIIIYCHKQKCRNSKIFDELFHILIQNILVCIAPTIIVCIDARRTIPCIKIWNSTSNFYFRVKSLMLSGGSLGTILYYT